MLNINLNFVTERNRKMQLAVGILVIIMIIGSSLSSPISQHVLDDPEAMAGLQLEMSPGEADVSKRLAAA